MPNPNAMRNAAGVTEFRIELADNKPAYLPGDVIIGKVVIATKKKITSAAPRRVVAASAGGGAS